MSAGFSTPQPAGEAPDGGLTEAWVAFADHARPCGYLWWLRWLKPGFRHCFVLLGGARHWVVIDPTAAFTDVGVWDRAAAPDLPRRLARLGLVLAPAPLRRDAIRPAAWAPFTCVEAVKRTLGLRAPWAMTPWGLYRHLTRPIRGTCRQPAIPSIERTVIT
jgi:hypothetical protein